MMNEALVMGEVHKHVCDYEQPGFQTHLFIVVFAL